MSLILDDLYANPVRFAFYRSNAHAFARDFLGFHPNPKQAEVLSVDTRQGILCCHRQWGKSTTTAAKAIHHAVFNPGSLTLVMAPTLRQSGELVRSITAFARSVGYPGVTDGLNRVSLQLGNGARIIAIPSDDDNIRGFSSVALLLVDEAARVPDSAYYAALPMLAANTGGIWLMSTPKGRTGFFYETWTAAEPSWVRVLATAEDSGRIPPAGLESQRSRMPADRFREEYLCCFRDSEEQLFPSAQIDAAFVDSVPPLRDGQIDIDLSKTVGIHYCIGVDLGQARDHTVIAALEVLRELATSTDPLTGRPLERLRLRLRHLDRVPLDTAYSNVAGRIRTLLQHPHFRWATSSLVIDYTGVGRGFRDILSLSGVRTNLVPVTITGGSAANDTPNSSNVPKRHLIGTLQILLQNQRLEIASALDNAGTLRLELGNLQRSLDGYRAGNAAIHDDTVLATALAAWYAAKRYRGVLPPGPSL